MRITPHRRQFLIARSAHRAPDWTSVEIGSGLVLSHCRALPVTIVQRGSGRAVVIGLAIPDQGEAEADQLVATAEQVTPDLYERWFGRWVLIADGEIHLDPGATLSVFYTREGSRGPLVSSSAALVQELSGRPAEPPWAVKHRFKINWIPGPSSGFPGTSRLLPTGVLDLGLLFGGASDPARGRQHVRSDLHDGDADTILAELRDLFRAGVAAAARRFGSITIPLSSGADSRTILAAAIAAGLRPRTFTFHKTIACHGVDIAPGDARLPRKMSRLFGFRHSYIRPRRRRKDRDLALHHHTAGRFDDVDRHYIANRQWDQAPFEGVVIRGGMFDMGKRGKLEKWLAPAYQEGTADFVTALLERSRASRHYDDCRPLRAALEQWIQWTDIAPLPGVDLIDRFQLDQRIGCWQGDIEQALDLVQQERFHLANNARVISLLLSLPIELRRSGDYKIRIIESLTPGLAQFPINPPKSDNDKLLERARSRLRRLVAWGRR